MYIHERKSETVLDVLGNIGGFNDAILLIVGPLMLYYSSLQFSIAIPQGTPVILKSMRNPTGKNKALTKRINDMVQKQTLRVSERLKHNQDVILSQ